MADLTYYEITDIKDRVGSRKYINHKQFVNFF